MVESEVIDAGPGGGKVTGAVAAASVAEGGVGGCCRQRRCEGRRGRHAGCGRARGWARGLRVERVWREGVGSLEGVWGAAGRDRWCGPGGVERAGERAWGAGPSAGARGFGGGPGVVVREWGAGRPGRDGLVGPERFGLVGLDRRKGFLVLGTGKIFEDRGSTDEESRGLPREEAGVRKRGGCASAMIGHWRMTVGTIVGGVTIAETGSMQGETGFWKRGGCASWIG